MHPRLPTVIVAGCLSLGLAGCSSSTSPAHHRHHRKHAVTISKGTFDGVWPFTVSSGRLRCVNRPGPVITFTASGTTYGVNGTAQDAGYPKFTPIWKRNSAATQAQGHGPRRTVGDVITRGLALCGIG